MNGPDTTSTMERDLSELVSAYPSPQMALLPVLQRLMGRPEEERDILARVAALCDVSEHAVSAMIAAHWKSARPTGSAKMCVGLSCVLNGAHQALRRAREQHPEFAWMGSEIEPVGCLGRCYAAPVFVDGAGDAHRIDISNLE